MIRIHQKLVDFNRNEALIVIDGFQIGQNSDDKIVGIPI